MQSVLFSLQTRDSVRASDFWGHREPIWQVFSSQCSASPSSGPSQASAAPGNFTLHLCLQGRWHSSTSRPKPAAGVSSGSCLGSWTLVGSGRGATEQELATARGPGIPLNSKAPG
ncbi:unnamed protein product [Rangifer tarandus platyrhynchus]|uniref:Uncharacterized protein n=2 Tax=Rangifer tarandus platyrhynchus TaxID=3082113 RepID=A0ABN8ZWV4_RANTA|nr:unnamed protein product [Rangifer tarandus platyrhynchus]